MIMIMSTIGALAILLLEHEENYADVHNLIQKIPSFHSIATNCNSNQYIKNVYTYSHHLDMNLLFVTCLFT